MRRGVPHRPGPVRSGPPSGLRASGAQLSAADGRQRTRFGANPWPGALGVGEGSVGVDDGDSVGVGDGVSVGVGDGVVGVGLGVVGGGVVGCGDGECVAGGGVEAGSGLDDGLGDGLGEGLGDGLGEGDGPVRGGPMSETTGLGGISVLAPTTEGAGLGSAPAGLTGEAAYSPTMPASITVPPAARIQVIRHRTPSSTETPPARTAAKPSQKNRA